MSLHEKIQERIKKLKNRIPNEDVVSPHLEWVLIELEKEEAPIEKKEDEPICVICHHSIKWHIEETSWHRCHSLGSDLAQCECRLPYSISRDVTWWDLNKRDAERLKEEEFSAPKGYAEKATDTAGAVGKIPGMTIADFHQMIKRK